MITGRSTQNSQNSICMQPHLETMKHNTDALILYEIQNKEQNDQISSLKNKINNLEKNG
jgi:hypothetical protein